MSNSSLPADTMELSSTSLIDLEIQPLLDKKSDVLRATPSRESREIRSRHNRANKFVTMLTHYECMVATVALLDRTTFKAVVNSCTLLREAFNLADRDSKINWQKTVWRIVLSEERKAEMESIRKALAGEDDKAALEFFGMVFPRSDEV